MSVRKFILIVFFLGILLGLGFLAFKSNTKIVQKPHPEVPTKVPNSPIKPTPSNIKEFGQAVTLKLNDKVTFSDGLIVILTQIDDSRCPANVQCIWAGEIAVALQLTGGKLSNAGEIHLATVTQPTANPENYTLTLKAADAKTAIIVVTYKK